MTRLEDVAADPVFETTDRTWAWGHVFQAAALWGEWDPWITSLPADPGVDEVGFRRARRLISGDELRAWLGDHRLTVDDWRGWLAAETADPWAAGVCDGTFDAWAERLAERAAALAAVGDATADEPLPAAERAYARLCADAVQDDVVKRLVTTNTVDWLRVDCELIQSADEDVAREAALLVREDGLGLPEVARIAKLPLAADRVWVGELPAELRPRFVSAAPGELVGPVASNGHFVLAHVHAKVVPDVADPEIRARAEDTARAAAVERAVLEEVRWRGRE